MQKGTNTTSSDTSYSNKVSEVNNATSSLFNKIFTFENLYNSYLNCIKGVRWKQTTQAFMFNAWYRIALLYNDLHTGKYKMGDMHFFKVCERGKTRNISALTLRDRIVHKCLCDNYLTNLLSKKLIYDSGATIKNKGILFAKNRVVAHLQKYYRHYGNTGYVLKIDFHNYFESIDHETLMNKLSKVINDDYLLNFIKMLIPSEVKGLGLGSQISQICAMYYLNDIDHYCKEKLKLKYYARYMDDIYAVHYSREKLIRVLFIIKSMARQLGVELNQDKTKIIELEKGFVFCKVKYVLTKTGKVKKLINARSFRSMKRKIKRGITFDSVLPSWLSYISWFNCHKKTYEFINKYLRNEVNNEQNITKTF